VAFFFVTPNPFFVTQKIIVSRRLFPYTCTGKCKVTKLYQGRNISASDENRATRVRSPEDS